MRARRAQVRRRPEARHQQHFTPFAFHTVATDSSAALPNTLRVQWDDSLQTLTAAGDGWVRLPIEAKMALLRDVRSRVTGVAPAWAAASARAKGIEGSHLAGEEWIAGPWALLYAVNRYLRTLSQVARYGKPRLPPRAWTAAGRHAAATVFPADAYDRALLPGIRAEVRLRPGVAPGTEGAAAAPLSQPHAPGRVALVLGAGNVSSIAPLDVLYKLLAGGAVCLLKLNPVNEYLGPIFENVLSPFVERGYVRFAYGDAAAGAALCAHPAIDEIHLTGSQATYDAIVAAGIRKPITSELGNVTPTIVIPGDWTPAQLRFQAEHVVTQKLHNAGFNCVAAQVLVLPRSWHLRDRFLAEIRAVAATIDRPQYYPGAAERRRAYGPARDGTLSLVYAGAGDLDDRVLRDEAFCAVLGVVDLPGDGPAYLEDAVRFVHRLPGTLGVNVIVDPQTERALGDAFDDAVGRLRYGCIGVNAWTGLGFFLTETPWGAYRGDDAAANAARGVVHNAYFLEGTEKTVVRAPFRSPITPPWFVTNPKQAAIGKALCDFEAARSPLNAARVALAALS